MIIKLTDPSISMIGVAKAISMIRRESESLRFYSDRAQSYGNSQGSAAVAAWATHNWNFRGAQNAKEDGPDGRTVVVTRVEKFVYPLGFTFRGPR